MKLQINIKDRYKHSLRSQTESISTGTKSATEEGEWTWKVKISLSLVSPSFNFVLGMESAHTQHSFSDMTYWETED